jgi:hypothetical protein
MAQIHNPSCPRNEKQCRVMFRQLLTLVIPQSGIEAVNGRHEAKGNPLAPEHGGIVIGHPAVGNDRKSKRQCLSSSSRHTLSAVIRHDWEAFLFFGTGSTRRLPLGASGIAQTR